MVFLTIGWAILYEGGLGLKTPKKNMAILWEYPCNPESQHGGHESQLEVNDDKKSTSKASVSQRKVKGSTGGRSRSQLVAVDPESYSKP